VNPDPRFIADFRWLIADWVSNRKSSIDNPKSPKPAEHSTAPGRERPVIEDFRPKVRLADGLTIVDCRLKEGLQRSVISSQLSEWQRRQAALGSLEQSIAN
jgi:hypothetical protein